ncbi:MAG TPA: DUF4105 domain-containing protein [Gemmatimonadaceae bacterium]|nr:DUF4105 domain-containing protein [Gemmatimonadaceae bacterium]
MQMIAVVRGACTLALLSGAVRAQEPVAPPSAIAAARAAMTDTVRGASLRVSVLTAAHGDAYIWDRFGHNLLRITDLRSGESVVWNWGLFDFDEPGFITRFLFGDTRYRMDSGPAIAHLQYYQYGNREVVEQELALTPGQRAALDAFVRENVRGDNKYYRYDYFLDNCSTRLRDALDIVTGGALRRSLESRSTDTRTYRTETLRLVQQAPWFFVGMDLALGKPADAALTDWQSAFIPMRLRDALRAVTVDGADGKPTPLVVRERVLVAVDRAPVPEGFDGVCAPMMVLIGGLVLALAIVGVSMTGPRGASTSLWLGSAAHLLFGVLASLIVFMWSFTKHTFWAWNYHLLLFTPVSLVLVVALPMARARPRLARLAERYHVVVAASAFLVMLATLLSHGGRLSAASWLLFVWANVAWLIHLAIGIVLRRTTPAPGNTPAH